MTFRSVSQKQDEKGSVRHAACTTTAVNCSYAIKVTIYNCRICSRKAPRLGSLGTRRTVFSCLASILGICFLCMRSEIQEPNEYFLITVDSRVSSHATKLRELG